MTGGFQAAGQHLNHLPVLRVHDIIAWMHARSAA
jgi:hypothetical protein